LPIGRYAFGLALLWFEADRCRGQWKTNWTNSCAKITWTVQQIQLMLLLNHGLRPHKFIQCFSFHVLEEYATFILIAMLMLHLYIICYCYLQTKTKTKASSIFYHSSKSLLYQNFHASGFWKVLSFGAIYLVLWLYGNCHVSFRLSKLILLTIF